MLKSGQPVGFMIRVYMSIGYNYCLFLSLKEIHKKARLTVKGGFQVLFLLERIVLKNKENHIFHLSYIICGL